MVDTTRILQKVFSGLEDPDLGALRQVIERRHVPAGSVICREGEIGHEFYIVGAGQAAVSKRMGEGEEQVLATVGAGEFFGEMALVEHKPRAATVTALEEMELLVINESVFEQVVARNPIVALAIMRRISSSLRRTDRLAMEELQRKNEQLRRAYQELKAAQEQLIEKERLERELEIAAEVQRSILPTHFPVVSGFSYAARAVPARKVGGDFYDLRIVSGEKLGVLMADVSGKSVHAAIYMAVTRGLFLTEARHSESPGEVIRRVHSSLLEMAGPQSMFVTAFYGVINARTGRMCYARAGHDPPLHFRRGMVHSLPGEGRFLGLFDGMSLDEQELQLLPGDLLVLYSDGVTDAIDTAGEQFGLERLGRIVQERAGLGAQAVCDTIFDRVFRFQGAASQFDDMTVQVIAYEPDNTNGGK
jgi:sigma-B regulation protein RsbU (phosphoserine phosphatase)